MRKEQKPEPQAAVRTMDSHGNIYDHETTPAESDLDTDQNTAKTKPSKNDSEVDQGSAPCEFNKVDRALELAVIDWLQWAAEFDENKASLALDLISKRKAAYDKLKTELAEMKLHKEERDRLIQQKRDLTAERDRLRAALEFYSTRFCDGDNGETAQDALRFQQLTNLNSKEI